MEISIKLPIFLETGVINYENLEVGIWKLVNEHHSYNLKNLPVDFQKVGLKVAVILKKEEDEMDIFMHGTFYEVLSIKEFK